MGLCYENAKRMRFRKYENENAWKTPQNRMTKTYWRKRIYNISSVFPVNMGSVIWHYQWCSPYKQCGRIIPLSSQCGDCGVSAQSSKHGWFVDALKKIHQSSFWPENACQYSKHEQDKRQFALIVHRRWPWKSTLQNVSYRYWPIRTDPMWQCIRVTL